MESQDRGGGLKILIIHRGSRAILNIAWPPHFSLSSNKYLPLL